MEPLDHGIVDLHVHTTYSDGELTTSELLLRARRNGVEAVVITDHDNVDAFHHDIDIIRESGVQVIPGVEISTETDEDRHHILGINIDPNSEPILLFTEVAQKNRVEYAREVIDRLRRSKWNIDDSIVFPPNRSVTKVQIAKAMLETPGNGRLIKSYTGVERPTTGMLIEATLIEGMPFFIPKKHAIHPRSAVETIHESGGAAVLAHPSFNITRGVDPNKLFHEALEWGVDGLEGIYVQFDRSDNDRPFHHRKIIAEFCIRYGLVMTGGSDFHTADAASIGAYIDIGFYGHNWKVPRVILDRVLEISERNRVHKP